jgi:hypothetical protein
MNGIAESLFCHNSDAYANISTSIFRQARDHVSDRTRQCLGRLPIVPYRYN